MEKTPAGTSVGVDDPYEHAGVCDHCTGDGKCRFAFDHFASDPEFGRARRADGYACPVADPDGDWEAWRECPHYRSTADGGDRECARCGLAEKRVHLDDRRPLLEEHHLSYAGEAGDDADGPENAAETDADGDEPAHEITVHLCRWCHATVHESWGRIDDDVSPDPEAIAAREQRRSREEEELGFETAAERYGDESATHE